MPMPMPMPMLVLVLVLVLMVMLVRVLTLLDPDSVAFMGMASVRGYTAACVAMRASPVVLLPGVLVLHAIRSRHGNVLGKTIGVQ